MTEVTVPTVGESISEVQISQWHKAEGEWVAADETLVDLETEKAAVQVPAPISGIVRNIRKKEGEFAAVGEVLCDLEPAEAPTGGDSPPPESRRPDTSSDQAADAPRVMPAAARLMEEHGLSPADVQPTGPGDRILKEDVLAAVEAKRSQSQPRINRFVNRFSKPAFRPPNRHRGASCRGWKRCGR